ncbi:Lysosomal alpha-mannosidase, partial [Blattella germanica]
FFTGRNNIQNAGVQYIIDSVIDSLTHDPNRRFIYVETAFFWKWWVEQTESTQQIVKDLVNEGRLEFIGGAWSMNDEAASNYYSTIDQFTWGLRKLNDTFGSCGRPHVGWQIDPFGHSREMASMFARMGYDGLIFGRLDYQDKSHRLQTKTPEMVWEGSANLGTTTDLFTSILYDFYTPPSGFCFDIMCSDTPIIDDKRSADYNVDQRVQDFLDYVHKHEAAYTTNNILVTMGGDFNYQDALTWFKNLDKLIKYTNAADSNVNVIYSTPSCYLKAVNDAGQTYTTKQDDFFPYASDPHAYWTGYFTSRPTSKYFERLGNNFLQHVAEDYARILTNAIEDASSVAETAINALISDGTNNIEVHNCLKLNVSACTVSEHGGDQFVVTVYNPLGDELTIQLVPIHEKVLSLPERQGSEATHDLVFTAQLPALGFKSFYVTRVNTDAPNIEPSTDLTIGTTTFSVTLDESTGLVKSITNGADEIPLDQRFHYYEGFIGNNAVFENRSSGAYIFRPVNSDPKEVSSSAEFKVYKGDVVDEIHQTFNSWVSQVVRIYKSEMNVEFEWLVDGVFYTDSNGREMLERKRNYRPTWTVDVAEPAAGNYYPITSKIEMRASGYGVAILNDRAQGGSSLNDGQVELMLHRRLLHDDAFGVGEALNETAFNEGLIARGKQYLMAGKLGGVVPSLIADERETAQRVLLAPWLFFSFSGLVEDLPRYVNIHTLEPWKPQIKTCLGGN